MKPCKRLLALLPILLPLTACYPPDPQAGTVELSRPAAAQEPTAHLPSVVTAQSRLSFQEFIQQLASRRVILVGETHDRNDHHQNQLAVLRALYQQNPRLALGVEWFQQPFQPVLDDYLAGRISESEMLRRTEYDKRWGYDYAMLRPILEFAKAHQILVIALNIPVEITHKVAKGGLENLTLAERKQLPTEIPPADPAYRAQLEKVFAQHAHHGMQGNHADKMLENFLLVQRIWDAGMAERAARFLRAHPQQRMLILAGSGHIAGNSGIQSDLKRLLPGIQSATAVSAEAEDIEPGLADYIMLATGNSSFL